MDQIQMINTLDSVARVTAKDCVISKDGVVFLIPEKYMKKAIGKNGSTVEKLMKKINKKVEFFEYDEKPEKFLEKAFFRSKIEKVEIKKIKEKKVAFVKADAEGKKLILRNLNRLKKVKELAKRNYGIEEVRIR